MRQPTGIAAPPGRFQAMAQASSQPSDRANIVCLLGKFKVAKGVYQGGDKLR